MLNYSPEKQPLETAQKITLAEIPHYGEFNSPQTRSSSGGIHQATPFSDYQSIVDNNIFRPLGWEKVKPAPILPVVRRRREIPLERPEPTYALTLTGIAKKGREQVALIEDSKEKEGYFLRSGEQLKDCTVNAIESEQIVLAKAGSEIKLALGEEILYNTSGQIILSSSAGASRLAVRPKQNSSRVEGAQKSESLSVSEDERLRIIMEQMKANRRKELNKE